MFLFAIIRTLFVCINVYKNKMARVLSVPLQYHPYMKRGPYGSYGALPDWKRQQIGFPAAKGGRRLTSSHSADVTASPPAADVATAST